MKEKSLKVPLNRLFYIFHPAVYPWLFATLAGLVAAGIALILSGKASPRVYIPVALLTFFFGNGDPSLPRSQKAHGGGRSLGIFGIRSIPQKRDHFCERFMTVHNAAVSKSGEVIKRKIFKF